MENTYIPLSIAFLEPERHRAGDPGYGSAHDDAAYSGVAVSIRDRSKPRLFQGGRHRTGRHVEASPDAVTDTDDFGPNAARATLSRVCLQFIVREG